MCTPVRQVPRAEQCTTTARAKRKTTPTTPTPKKKKKHKPWKRPLYCRAPDPDSLLREHYVPTVPEGMDEEAFLRVFAAVLRPDPCGFVVTDSEHTGGQSLWAFACKCLGKGALATKATLLELHAWNLLHKFQLKLRGTDPAKHQAIMQDLEWQPASTHPRTFTLAVPRRHRPALDAAPATEVAVSACRPGHEKQGAGVRTQTVRAKFYMGCTLRAPSPELDQALVDVLHVLAPDAPQDLVEAVLQEYAQLWWSHEALPLECVRYRRIVT